MRTITQLIIYALLCSLPAAGVQGSDAVRDAVERLQPNATDIRIQPSPIPGVSQVSIGLQVLYVSDDGAFALGGPLLALKDGTNLTEQRLATARAEVLSQASEVPVFHYPAADVKHKVTVFTDIDCPHCRRMHTELPAMQAAGIDVTYVLLPRAGKGSASYQKSISVACAQDPEASITAAMAGQQPSAATCEHPIDAQLDLSRQLNVRSTPSIVLEDGQLVLGYHTADRLLNVIEQRMGSNQAN